MKNTKQTDGIWEQLRRPFKISNTKVGRITRMHLFIAMGYIFKNIIEGSYFICETEEDVYESISHFRFLSKYGLINNL